MTRLSRILPLAAIAACAVTASPAAAFVGYGIESGTPLYEALSRGYRPYPYYYDHPDYYRYMPTPPPRRWQRGHRRHRGQ